MTKVGKNLDKWDGSKPQVVVPDGYVSLRLWCKEHSIPYSLIYSRINQRKIEIVKRGGHYFVSEHMDPEQFRQGKRYGWDYDNRRVAQRAAAIKG